MRESFIRYIATGEGTSVSDGATADPPILLDGASRAIFAVAEDGGGGTRQVLVNLDLGRAGAVAVSGNTHVYERVPGAIPSGTATSVFAGFYAPGTEFGCFTVRYTTD